MKLDYSYAIQQLYQVNNENSPLRKDVFEVNFDIIKKEQARLTEYLMENSNIEDNIILVNLRLQRVIENLEKIYHKSDGKGIEVKNAIFDIDILSQSINTLLIA